MHDVCGKIPVETFRYAEGVTLSGVLRNTKPHADTTLEIPIQLGAEGARDGLAEKAGTVPISQAKGQGR